MGKAWAQHGPLCWQRGCFKSLEDPLSLAPCQTITGFVSFKAGQRGSFQWSPHKTSLWDEPSTRRKGGGLGEGGGKRDRMTSAMTSLCSQFPKKSQKPYKERTKNTLRGVQAAPTPPPQNGCSMQANRRHMGDAWRGQSMGARWTCRERQAGPQYDAMGWAASSPSLASSPLAGTTPSVPSQHPGTCYQDASTTLSLPFSGVMRCQE